LQHARRNLEGEEKKKGTVVCRIKRKEEKGRTSPRVIANESLKKKNLEGIKIRRGGKRHPLKGRKKERDRHSIRLLMKEGDSTQLFWRKKKIVEVPSATGNKKIMTKCRMSFVHRKMRLAAHKRRKKTRSV